ncbi:MAG: dihydrofolate reductase family protein [Clostridia bacterium]|nr:dihydrofolate reductase family protein [Clostridia bacterium]
MDRTFVSVHMYVSIDGKIDGEYMDEHGCDISGEFYDEVISSMGTAMASGRHTSEIYHAKAKIDYSAYSKTCELKDNVEKFPRYHFTFDRMGKCNWDNKFFEYGGEKMLNVAVLSRKVRPEYVSYLKENGFSYIFADSVKEALEKIYGLGVEKLVLTGGATIVGGFIKENLVDEISLVVAPYVQGTGNYKNFCELSGEYLSRKFVIKSTKPLADGGIQLVFIRG